MSLLRIGILGSARIARSALIEPAANAATGWFASSSAGLGVRPADEAG